MIRRKAFEKLKEQENNKKVVLLLGARQVGKTTLLKALYEETSKNSKSLFLDLDIVSNYEKVSSYENLINTLKLNGYKEDQKEFFHLFLDEFQRYIPLAKIMKNVYDSFSNIKIYASGSSSIAIKDQVQESLAGRKRIIELYPLDFEEFVWSKQDKKLNDNLANAKKLKGENLSQVTKELNQALQEFLIFGGYPEVVLKSKKEEKIEVLQSIFDLYVRKDLIDYMKIEKILTVKKLIEFLSLNNGQKIKYEEISSMTSATYLEIKEYIELLEETYLISVLKPFYTNKNKELVKIPKIYFIDNGVRNYFIKNFNDLAIRNDAGFLFEGFIISELIKKGIKNLRFWQDKNKNEIDLIIDQETHQVPIEIKFKKNLKSDDYRGIKAIMKEYKKIRKTYLINLGIQKQNKNTTLILPYSLKKIIV
jgi:hypothetical protein